jgi:hypothetical protein
MEDKQYSREALREFVCSAKLIGSQHFTATDLEDPIVVDLDGKNPCLRRGPWSLAYWVNLFKRRAAEAWSPASNN